VYAVFGLRLRTWTFSTLFWLPSTSRALPRMAVAGSVAVVVAVVASGAASLAP
jgi:hypothetical protein